MPLNRWCRPGDSAPFLLPLLSFSLFMVCFARSAGGEPLYVRPGGGFGEYASIQAALFDVQPGEEIIVRDGVYAESLQTQRPALADARITLRAENLGKAVITHSGGLTMRVWDPYYSIEGFIFDGQFGNDDILRVYTDANALVFRNNEIRRGRRDGMDLAAPADVLIENCHIHDLLWIDAGVRYDAHGIVTDGATNMTIRNCEIHYVSGDSFQAARGGWNNILIEDCDFWNGPLPEAAVGFAEGMNPGENAIDTKKLPSQGRGQLILRGCDFHGWKSDYIPISAALNLKEHVSVTVDACEIRDNRTGFRMRGAPDDTGAHVTVRNCLIHDNDLAMRYEDDIQQLQVYNNTFDEGEIIGENVLYSPDYPPLAEGFLNNLFLSTTLPAECDDPSNLAVGPEAFVDAANGKYRLAPQSPALDAGIDLRSLCVFVDRDTFPRPQRTAFDVGAYETPIPGDTDGDSDVDASDLAAVGLHWLPAGTDRSWGDGDFDSDGDVDAADLASVGLHWAPGGLLPEPASALFATVTLLGFLLRRPGPEIECG